MAIHHGADRIINGLASLLAVHYFSTPAKANLAVVIN